MGNTKAVSEEYRYDALGRRVWVSSTRSCTFALPDTPAEPAECRASFVRRIVWDGAQELVEIQMPLGPVWEENDTAPVTLQHTNGEDQNPYYGRVLYTPGLQVDQPVAVTRVGYHDQPVSSTTPTAWPAFTLSLFWNSRGQAALGAFSDGAAVRQLAPGTGPCSTGSDAQRCVRVFWPTNWAAYDPRPGQTVFSWHGSLLEDKMDKVGTGFRRNRHYDPQTGRFTQEDPIGLAGGVNLYGFAAGDPVNFADPFGLTAGPEQDVAFRILTAIVTFLAGQKEIAAAIETGAPLPEAQAARSIINEASNEAVEGVERAARTVRGTTPQPGGASGLRGNRFGMKPLVRQITRGATGFRLPLTSVILCSTCVEQFVKQQTSKPPDA